MKPFNHLLSTGLAVLLLLLLTGMAYGQQDVVLKTDGEEMRGTVTQITDEDVHFVYQNERVDYVIDKSDIAKITFSSGRIQYFNHDEEALKPYLSEHHNVVAILPFAYIKDQETSNPAMVQKIQMETFSIFQRKARNLRYQDINTTNALLRKAGITDDNIQGYTMGELCHILGVEYVVQGMITVDKTYVSNRSGTTSRTDSRRTREAYVDRRGRVIGTPHTRTSSTTSRSSYSSSQQNYETDVTMNVYNDHGENIFSMSHQSFWQTQDAYQVTLAYLAKRTPLYKR